MEKLPEDLIIRDILTRVPLRDAVRTSVLSPAWHLRWRFIPDLNFKNLRGAIINNILLLHEGCNIRSFSFDRSQVTATDTDRLLLQLSKSRDSLSSLQLFFSIYTPTPLIGSSLYSLRSLTTLSLYNCEISSQTNSNSSFPLLQSLRLDNVIFPDEQAIHRLISNSSNLTSLSLIDIDISPSTLRLFNPNLHRFYYRGEFCNHIVFAAAQVLKFVGIIVYCEDNEHLDLARIFPAGAVCNGKLQLFLYTVEALANNGVSQSIPASCFHNLTNLHIQVDFNKKRHIMVLFCLMRSAPNLQKLSVQGLDGDEHTRFGEHFWKEQAVCHLDRLRIMKLQLWTGIQVEISDLILYVLERAKLLQKVTICDDNSSHSFSDSTLDMLRNYQGASPQTKIIYNEDYL